MKLVIGVSAIAVIAVAVGTYFVGVECGEGLKHIAEMSQSLTRYYQTC